MTMYIQRASGVYPIDPVGDQSPEATQDDRISPVAQEALRYFIAASAVSGIACAAWVFPWTCIISIPAMLLHNAFYETFPFLTIDGILGSETYHQLAEKTETIARNLLGTLFPLGSMEIGVGIFCALYGYSLISSASSFVTIALGALCISYSLQRLLPSGFDNLTLCNMLLHREYSALMQLNAYLREVRERRNNGDFQLDAQEVCLRIEELYEPKPEDLVGLSDSGIRKMIRHDPASLTLLLQFLSRERLESAIIPYFLRNINEHYLDQLSDKFAEWNYNVDNFVTLDQMREVLIDLHAYTNELRGFLYRLEHLSKIEDDRLAPLVDEMNRLKDEVLRLDQLLQDDDESSLRQTLLSRSTELSEETEAYYKLGTVIKVDESNELAPYLGLDKGLHLYHELDRRGLRTIEDLDRYNIWISDQNDWPSLKARLIDFLDSFHT